MKWDREAYIELMTFGKIERQMFVELFGPLVGLDQEWMAQGAGPDEIGLNDFDFDYVPVVSCGGNTGVMGGITPYTITENDRYLIQIDEYGRQTKLCKGYATVPLPIDYPVKDMDSWLKIKSWFTYRDDRIDLDAVLAAQRAQQHGALVLAWMPGGFDLPRQLLGEENLCFAYYDQPELIQDILATAADTACRVLGQISSQLVIDNLCVHEDMAGKSGPLIGPDCVREFIKPYYRRVWDMLSANGTRLFSQDSDGNINPVIDAFLESGVNVMYPAEPAAGMDIVDLRRKYGNRLAFKGGIDKHVLRQDKPTIRRELEYKLQSLMQQGGNVFGLDHRIPNGTPLANYRYYVETAREILGLPPRGNDHGWARMAF